MESAAFYRERAAHIRLLHDLVHQRDMRDTLAGMARDYDEVADDVESGKIEIRHPALHGMSAG